MSILNEIKSRNLVEVKLKNKIILEQQQLEYLEKLEKDFNLTREEIIAYALEKLNLQRIYSKIKKESEAKKEKENQGKVNEQSEHEYRQY